MTARYIIGDTRAVLATLEPASVDLVLTSPPFLALRSYLPAGHPDKAAEIGSEATPGAYIDTLLDVVEACARVLAPHGTMMFELGDTYAGSGGAGGDYNPDGLRDGQPAFHGSASRVQQVGNQLDRPRCSTTNDRTEEESRLGVDARNRARRGGNATLSRLGGWPLDRSLCLIPELFRVSLVYGFNPLTGRQTPRWRARNIIRWCRPNPPVGALGDKFRPATSELVVVCRNRRYFDLDAVRQPHNEANHRIMGRDEPNGRDHGPGVGGGDSRGVGFSSQGNPAGAPPLDWWKIPTQPYDGAHYASWPEQLCVIPVKAMCPAFVCLDCGTALGSMRDSGDVLRGMRNGDSGSLGEDPRRTAQAAILFQDVLQSQHREEPEKHQGLDTRPEGLHPGLGARASNGQSRRLRNGASAGYGEEVGTTVDGGRRGPSSQRSEGRQPPGESGALDEGAARPVSEDEETHRMPVLRARRSVDGKGTCCGSCGSTNLRVGRTLDPFAGSGTTLQVATGHGRDAIGIDLDQRNAELALGRVGPLMLTVETVEAVA